MPDRECPKGDEGCGQVHRGCIAHNRAGGPCGARPMKGTDPPRCSNHVGKSLTLVRAENDARERALTLLRIEQETYRRHGVASTFNPFRELEKIAVEAIQWKNITGRMVAELAEFRYRSGNGEHARSEILFWERGLDRAARICVDLAKLDIVERLALIDTRTQGIIAKAIEGILTELGHDARAPEVRNIVGRHLRLITADPEEASA
jgi:hypothetical protein